MILYIWKGMGNEMNNNIVCFIPYGYINTTCYHKIIFRSNRETVSTSLSFTPYGRKLREILL